jgi:hypothetical protein
MRLVSATATELKHPIAIASEIDFIKVTSVQFGRLKVTQGKTDIGFFRSEWCDLFRRDIGGRMIWQKYWEGLDVRNPSLEKQYGFSETRL